MEEEKSIIRRTLIIISLMSVTVIAGSLAVFVGSYLGFLLTGGSNGGFDEILSTTRTSIQMFSLIAISLGAFYIIRV